MKGVQATVLYPVDQPKYNTVQCTPQSNSGPKSPAIPYKG